jgi:rsbT co-antagonist protein RsbR
MAEDPDFVRVAADRLVRLQRVVTLASEGAYAEAARLLGAPVRDGFGEVEQGLATFIDELRTAIEQNNAALDDLKTSKLEVQRRLATIERQQAEMRELSTPVIDVWEKVLTVPLIGLLDGGRMRDLTERLLARIGQAKTAWVILDLTGIESVDSTIADHLLKLAGAVRLMGAQCLLTGIGPGAAQTIVALGAELKGLRSMASLREGLKYCLARQSSTTG